MSESANPGTVGWSQTSAKTKNAVQKSVTALLDELAPERVVRRIDRPSAEIEQHRTPTGCVLQAPEAALSVSWFSEPSAGAPLGELNVVVWRGTVTRRGALRKAKGAEMVSSLVFRPIEPPQDDCAWEGADGKRYDAAAIAAHCLQLLQEQMR